MPRARNPTAASLTNKDERNQVIQDAALSYAELAKWEQRLARLKESEAQAEQMQASVGERVKAGIDSAVDEMRAHLSAARIRLRIAEAEGSAAVLREHLSKMTGLPAAGIQTDRMPFRDFPALQQDDATPARAADASPSVQAAVEHARAQYLRAKGEHRALWPSFDFAAQYALLSTFNNFQFYYIPVETLSRGRVLGALPGQCLQPEQRYFWNLHSLSLLQRFAASARAAADADALKATRQADAASNQASEETLRLQRSVTQMQAALDVAQLEYEIARRILSAIQTRMDAGTANLHDLDDARSQASERFITLQDVTLELQRSELGLLRSTGDLEKWALGKP